MIIGISGKIGSGKDTVGKIIQYLIANNIEDIKQNEGTFHPSSEEDFTAFLKCDGYSHSGWKIVKFADALKDIVCILTGCTREQLESPEFKNSKLPDEWIRYGYANGFYKYYKNGKEETIMNNVQCDKERYELEYRTNWQTAYKIHSTYRELLQYIGTDLLRDKLHSDVWVNALMSKYYPKICSGVTHCALAGKPEISCNKCPEYPNWIITDVRFPNEAKAVKDRGGIIIRINRYDITGQGKLNPHTSETALDDAEFDYTIDNHGTIEELIEKVREMLIKEKLL